jgi:DNA-binding CsgD family transcriptional regulator
MTVLEATGLVGREELAYRALLKLPAATAGELAGRLGATAEEMLVVLRALEARGMVSLTPGSPPRYRAAPPDLAFGPLLRRREEEIEQIRTLVSDLADEYRSRVALRGAGELVEVVYGQPAIAQRMEQLQRTARREVRGLVKQPVIAVSAAENVTENAVIADGVRYRVLYDRELLELPDDPFRIALSARNGEESRIAADLPLKLAIADDALAIVPVAPPSPPDEPSAVLVHPSGLLDALCALFERLWATASPVLVTAAGVAVADDAAGVPSADDLHLLSLLLAGLTDQAIAGQLRVSVRTVQRRLRDMIEMTGVQTRVQLVWQATRRGWI